MDAFNRKTWTENYSNPLSPSEFDGWQDRLTELAGVEADGTPRLQLFWGMDMRPEHYVWDRYRKEWKPPFISRHVIDHVPDEKGIFKPVLSFIGVPRFFVRMLDVSQTSSPNNTAGKEKVVVVTQDTDRLGNLHQEAFEETSATFTEARFRRRPYVVKLEWAAHDYANEVTGIRKCCQEHVSEGYSGKCYGEYIAPDERMINRLRTEIFALRHMTHDDPDQAYKLWLAVEMKKKADFAQQMGQLSRDFAKRLVRMRQPFVALGGH